MIKTICNKKLAIFVLVVFTILALNIQSINAEIVDIKVGENELIFSKTYDEKTQGIIDIFKDPKLNDLQQYINNNYPLVDGLRGTFELDTTTFIVKFKTPDDKTVLEIPSEIRIKEIKDNQITFSSSRAGNSMKMEGFSITLNGGVPEITIIINKNGEKTFKATRGEFDIEVGDNIYKGITTNSLKNKKAEIRIDKNKNVIFASFVSAEGGKYNFEHQGKIFTFIAKKGGEVLFDLENNLITGENIELTFQKGQYGKVNYRKFALEGKFSVKIDNEGNPTEILIQDGIFKPDLLFGEVTQEFLSTNNEPLTVYFNGRDIKDFEGNAISIDDSKRKILLKGQIKGNGIKRRVNYEGKTKDTYTEFYYDGKDNDGIAYFDVQQGESIIDNGKRLVNIKNGIAILKIVPGNERDPTSFRFAVNDQGEITEVLVNEDNNNFIITAYKLNGDKITTEISLSELQSQFSSPLSEFVNIKTNKENLQLELNEIQKEINSGQYSGKELQFLELDKIIHQNQIDDLNGKSIDNSIIKLQNFIDINTDPEITAIVQNRLGELRLEQLSQYKTSYDSPVASRESEKARELFQETIKYADQQLRSPNLDPETKQRIELMRDQAILNTGKSYLNTKRSFAEFEFEAIIDPENRKYSSNNQIRSEANRLLALTKLEADPIKHTKFALDTLKKAVNEDPNNQLAAQTLKTLQLSLINARRIQFQGEGQRDLEDFFRIANENSPTSRYYAQFFGLDEHLSDFKSGLEEINVRRIGLRGMETLVANDRNINNFINSDFKNRFQDVMRSHNLETYFSAEEFGDYAKNLKFEKRTIDQDFRTLHSAIAQDKGTSVANAFRLDFEKITATIGSIEHAIKYDPMLHLIAGNGNEILNSNGISLYEGSQSLASAFTTDRVGDPIERTWTEAIGIETGDFILTAFAAGGTVGFLAKGAIYTGRAIGIGTQTARIISTTGNLLNPGRVFVTKFFPKASKASAIISEFTIDAGVGFSAPLLVPEAAVLLVDLGGFLPGSKVGNKISKIVNIANKADIKFFMYAANEIDADEIAKGLLNNGAIRRTDLGNNVYSKGGQIIQIGKEIDPGFRITSTHNLKSLTEYEVFGNPDYHPTTLSTKTEVRPGVTYRKEYRQKLSRADTTNEFSRTTRNVDSEGKILTKSNNLLKEGDYIWVVENGNLRTASLNDINGKRNIHAVLAEGRPVDGAGQFHIDKNGKIIEVTPQSGHYYPGTDINSDTRKVLGNEFDEQSKEVFQLATRRNGISIDKATFSRRITTNTKSKGIRNTQQILANNARQTNLPPNEIARIEKGNFNREEVFRINRAIDVLEREGFEIESNFLLESKFHQKLLILGHNAENIIAKTRALRKNGFSKQSMRVLTDRNVMILGNSYDNPRIIGSVEAIERNNLGEIVSELTVSDIQDAVSRTNVNEIFTTELGGSFGIRTDNIFGTKAVVYKNTEGDYVTAFTTESVNTHHAHVAAKLALDDGWDPVLAKQFSERGYYGTNRQLLERVSGFQLTFNRDTGKITHIDMSSSMTEAQIGEHVRFSGEELDLRINAIFDSIDPELLDNNLRYSFIEDPRQSNSIKPEILYRFILILIN